LSQSPVVASIIEQRASPGGGIASQAISQPSSTIASTTTVQIAHSQPSGSTGS